MQRIKDIRQIKVHFHFLFFFFSLLHFHIRIFLSLSLSNQILERRRKGRIIASGHGFTEQTPRDGHDEIVCICSILFTWSNSSLDLDLLMISSYLIDVLSSSWDDRMMSDYKVDTINDDLQMFYVTFHGPTDSNPLCLVDCLCL